MILWVATTYDNTRAEEILEQAVSEICNALNVLNEQGAQYVVVTNASDIDLILAFNKNGKAKALATELTESFNVKLANGLDDIRKSTDLETKVFDLNSKMKNMLSKY
ncbi:SGNH/GDSL hydrolase family protein [Wolbachia endosymbiont of Wuchereria bancrofti]|uniref:hypothetical protein n=1 Tax=Wolbachia endosymbiont of Wuchereria bancrofti TaxID=96496 RepID=UPI0003480BF9|nr:hypothetical protein [Wolbachia endosymbiont of Wuchereria bancrofti]OWZ25703.1 lipolytic enzyme, GDSL family [Wolbachia endosymbiont of Wuchereria bancrofti]